MKKISHFWTSAKSTTLIKRLLMGLVIVFGCAPFSLAMAQTTVNIAKVPLLALKSAPGLVMLTMSRDQRLFYAAYNEVTDIDGDGSLDVGFKESFDYYGYFVSDRCYQYDTSVTPNRYVPVSLVAPINTITGLGGCNASTGRWHGNWLNWMTTSRMDALRKVLYGGKRVTDTNTTTVLEAAHVPPDSHVWGKEFRPTSVGGTDAYKIENYTPLAAPGAGKQHIFLIRSEGTTTSPYIGTTPPTLRVAANVDAVIDRVWMWASSERPVGGAAGTTVYTRPAFQRFNPISSTIYNSELPGFSSGGTAYSGTTFPYAYNHTVRVQACVNLAVGGRESTCTGYPASAPTIYKPTGVLHEYSISDQLKFGLLTGSYTNNYSGGVLRKDISSFKNEVFATTGIFDSTANGIVKTIDSITTYGFNNSSQSYVSNSTNPVCPAGTFLWDRLRCQGEVNAWGAPVAEMMYEGLRYFTDKQPLTAYSTGVSSGTSADSVLGLPLVSTWSNPYRPTASGGSPMCSNPVQMVIADPITSFDADQLPGGAFTPDTGKGSTIPATDLTGLNVSIQADAIWANEFGASTNKLFFVGQSTPTNFDGNPSAKTTNTFKYLRGHGPDETNTQGSYYAASVAKFARETGVSVRNGTAVTADSPKNVKVDTIAVALGTVVPKLEIAYSGNKVTLVPFAKTVGGTCTNPPSPAPSSPAGFQPSNLITGMFIDRIANTATSNVDPAVNFGRPFARFMVSFSDMDVGGDNEADANAYYTLYVNGSGQLVVNVDPYNKATCAEQHLGYVISGTTTDGVYLEANSHTAAAVASTKYYLDTPPGVTPFPGGTRVVASFLPASASHTFTLSSSGSAATYIPHDPLWYAAKYGGPANVFNAAGDPANYFKVTNPATLPAQMGKAFRAASALAAVASTSVVGVGQRSLGTAAIYQANYDSLTWSSRLYAFPVSTTGVLSNTPVWESSALIPTAPASRTKMFLGRGGISTPIALSSTTFGSLSGSVDPTTSESGDFHDTATYDYLRGVKSGEERNGGTFRNRGITNATNTSTAIDPATVTTNNPAGTTYAKSTFGSVLGDIVNSDPQIISKKDYDYGDSDASYTSFYTGISTETIAVGSNAGFFHIFNADPTSSGGGELLAFMPQAARANIGNMAAPGFPHEAKVDGSIGLGHAKIRTPSDATVQWRSLAIGTGGGGAQTVFAVDASSTTFTANSIMWEINNLTTPAASLAATFGYGSTFGNIMGRPGIGKLADGTWVAVFGNGYNSTAERAFLYVVRLNDGAILRIIPTNNAITGNGMGATEIVRKTSGNRDTIDYVYGADYKGGVWRFDLSSVSGASGWPANGRLLYQTPTGRPITGEIKVGAAPTSALTTGGKMVYFGTGSYLSAADPATTTVQALYGVYDDLMGTSATTASALDANLTTMTITPGAQSDVRKTSAASSTTPWYTVAGKKGWVVPLTASVPPSTANIYAGERVIAPPVRYTITGTIDAFLFTSIVPSVDECTAGLDAWITGIDAMTGGYVKAFNSLGENSVRITGGSPRGVFVLQDGATPTMYISQTVFNNNISTNSFSTGTGGAQDVTINGVTGTTRIISIDLRGAAPSTTSNRQVWRQLK